MRNPDQEETQIVAEPATTEEEGGQDENEGDTDAASASASCEGELMDIEMHLDPHEGAEEETPLEQDELIQDDADVDGEPLSSEEIGEEKKGSRAKKKEGGAMKASSGYIYIM